MWTTLKVGFSTMPYVVSSVTNRDFQATLTGMRETCIHVVDTLSLVRFLCPLLSLAKSLFPQLKTTTHQVALVGIGTTLLP